MFKFYNYCFYRLANATKSWIDYSPQWAAAIIAFTQGLNIFSIINIALILFTEDKTMSGETSLYISIPLFILNIFFIFTTNKYNQLEKRWESESSKYKKLKIYLIWLYILLSFIVFVITLCL